jgi:RNase P subunit RPR2
MVMARLHIICGNCGCNDEFEYRTFDELVNDDGELSDHVGVSITCKNCSTIHSLEDNAEEIVKD